MAGTTPKETEAGVGVRTLIVDNDKAHAYSISESLERVGYECALATSGPEGARRIDQETFDLIVTDLVMNEVDGMEV
jgi:two-component system response regulator HydG